MQPSGRIVFMCQKSRCQHFLNLAKQKVFVNRMFLSTTTYRRKQSALFTKRESKIDQTLIPVEVDLDIKEKLEDKNRLMSELTARNICGIDIHQLEKDYHRSHELVARKKDLEEKRDTLVEQLKSLQNNQKDNPTLFSADDEEKLESLRQQFQETKSLIKEISADFSDTEERLILTGLSLPNRLHPDTPLENDRVEVQNGPELDPSASHIDIGQQYNLLKLSNIGDKAYYFHDSLALLEQALISYFSDKFRHDGYIQLASPEFFKQLTVEGCGIDWEQLLALESKSSKETANYLVGSSIMSFIAYLAKSTLTLTEDPSQYFTCGRNYRLATEKDHPGLFDATQTVKLNTMSVCQTPEMCYEVLEYETDRLWQIYNKFDIPCRIITKAAPSLHHSEELRTEIQLWARSIQQYIKVASSSLVSDYISRRLMVRHNNGKDNANMVYTEALDVTRLVAIILEYGNIQENTYQLPVLEFLNKWYIQKEVNTH